jgi:hypothetical protein
VEGVGLTKFYGEFIVKVLVLIVDWHIVLGKIGLLKIGVF